MSVWQPPLGKTHPHLTVAGIGSSNYGDPERVKAGYEAWRSVGLNKSLSYFIPFLNKRVF